MTELPESCKKLQTMNTADETNLRLEYEKTQDMAIHYDTLNWTIGSILIAGVFIMVGIIGDKIQLYPYIAAFSFIALLVWRLYYKRHKEIQRIKFTRLQDIEKELRLQQHLKVDCEDKKGKIFGIKGDHCATILTIGIPAALIIVYLIYRIVN